eukprot:1156404-Pelagomonas_calceolata.AAC.5
MPYFQSCLQHNNDNSAHPLPALAGHASGSPTRTIQLALRCRGDSPDALAAKLEDLLHTVSDSLHAELQPSR